MNNFTSIFEELSKLYEAEELEVADEEIPVEDIPAEEPEADEPKQLVLECENCGALVIKTEDEVTVDEATDLANVDDKCKFCEESAGYKILGELVAYNNNLEEGIGFLNVFKQEVPYAKAVKKFDRKPIKVKDIKKGDLIVDVPMKYTISDDSPLGYVWSIKQDKKTGLYDINYGRGGDEAVDGEEEYSIFIAKSKQEGLEEGVMDSFKKLAGKFKQLRTDSKLRKWARQNGGKLASSFKNRTKTTAKDLKAGQYFIPEFELENIDDKKYPAVAYPISKVTEKDIRWVDDKGNDTKVPGIEVSIGDDFFMGILPDMNVYVLSGEGEKSDDLEELLDINLDARGFGGKGNDVSVL